MMFKLTKNIASTVLSLAIVGIVYLFVADTYKWWPFESVTETVKIDETPNVVTEIRGIKKFTTACYYGDVTISKREGERQLVEEPASPARPHLPHWAWHHSCRLRF
ncbi:MAG: hypothetical protein L6U16_07515 [Porphyromonadaceae bacterium]|nr:MAG: hypothetical protein L6U16_07515 [Porphyromonadaceae bacterium]